MFTPEQRLQNIQCVVDELQISPHTRQTLLEHLYTNLTSQRILIRKMNYLIRWGFVCKLTNYGGRLSKTVFYVMPKNYHIILTQYDNVTKVYYFYKYNRVGDKKIVVNEYWELCDEYWKHHTTKIEFTDEVVLRWI